MSRAFFYSLLILSATALTGRAQMIYVYFKDPAKQPVQAISVKKSGEQIVVSRQVGPATMNDSVAVGAISQIVFPEPPQIKAANDLLAQGQAEAALAQVEPVLAYYADFKEIPGNRWAQAALFKIYALIALGREPEAEGMIAELGKTAADPDLMRTAQVQLVGSYLKKGLYKRVIEVLDPIVKDTQNAQLLADAWVKKGSAHLALKQYEAALRSFLRIPVLYSENKPLLPPSILGTARAYAGIEDFDHSKTTYDELLAQFPGTPEAAAAKSELKKVEAALQERKKKEEKEKAKG